MSKILVICGPTATGKTDLAIKMAKKFSAQGGGEIISADSRQVYKGMDIGTGKDLPKFSSFKLQSSIENKDIGFYLFDNIPVWLLDIVNPDYQFTVADYVRCADLVISDIHKRGKLPILTGGTGLYIKGLIDGIETMGVPPDWELREKLSHCSIAQLSNQLKQLNPQRWQRMNESDRKNPRRLIRAIEIASAKTQNPLGAKTQKNLDVLFVGLKAPYQLLYQRIDERVEERVKRGIEKEIKNLLAKGYTFENSVLGTTIGYKEWRPITHNSEPITQIIEQWKYDEHNYARRQMTWFKKALQQAQGHWFDITSSSWESEIERLVDKWYNNK